MYCTFTVSTYFLNPTCNIIILSLQKFPKSHFTFHILYSHCTHMQTSYDVTPTRFYYILISVTTANGTNYVGIYVVIGTWYCRYIIYKHAFMRMYLPMVKNRVQENTILGWRDIMPNSNAFLIHHQMTGIMYLVIY